MYNLKELRQMGKEQGIKCTSNKNTLQLSKLLGIPHVKNVKFETHHRHTIRNPVPIIFKSIIGGDHIKFPSIYNAAKHIGKNCSCIPFYIKRNSTILYNGGLYKVEKKNGLLKK